MTNQQLRAAFDAKVRAGLFKRVAWRAPAHLREDLLQDAICQTWEAYVRYSHAGKELSDRNLVRLCTWKIIKTKGRSFVRTTARPRTDVLHPANYAKIPLVFLDVEPSDDVSAAASVHAAIATPHAYQEWQATITVERWFAKLAPRDKKILRCRDAGVGPRETAQKLGIAAWAVKARFERMDRELKQILREIG